MTQQLDTMLPKIASAAKAKTQNGIGVAAPGEMGKREASILYLYHTCGLDASDWAETAAQVWDAIIIARKLWKGNPDVIQALAGLSKHDFVKDDWGPWAEDAYNTRRHFERRVAPLVAKLFPKADRSAPTDDPAQQLIHKFIPAAGKFDLSELSYLSDVLFGKQT